MPRGDHWPNWRERLATGFEVSPDGCHLWKRSVNNRGYGVIYFDGKLHLAHRAAWLAEHGRHPEAGLVVDHICEVKRCVNAAHLREVTNRFNVLRSPDSPMNVSRRARECRNGHPYPPDVARNKKGQRICAACREASKGGGRHTVV